MYQVSRSQAWLLWGLGNLFFSFQFILRLSVGILREDIIQKFAIDAASFGTLAGYYYLGYAGMQIPLGIMLDRLSFRFVTFTAILTAAIGTMTFVASDNWNIVLLGRFLIGAGSGVGFLSIAKITKTCFEEKYHSMLLGLSFTFGLIGAVFGVTPMKLLFDHYGYNNTFNVLCATCLGIGIMMLILGNVKNSTKIEETSTKDSILKQILELILNPRILLIGISGGLMVGSLEGFADLWAIPYFEQVFNMPKIDSALVISFLYIGMCFGGPILASFAKLAKSETLMIFCTGMFTIAIFGFFFETATLSFELAAMLMFILGILCCYQVLVFSLVSSYVKSSNAALAIAVTNSINMSFGHFFHQLIGNSIQKNWDGALSSNGMPLYNREVFVTSLSYIPIACLVGIIGFAILSYRKK